MKSPATTILLLIGIGLVLTWRTGKLQKILGIATG